MYPAENGYALGLFTNEDLPNEIELYFSKPEPEPALIGPAIATYNGDGTWGAFNGGNGPFVEFAGGGWVSVYAESGPAGPAECLFTDKFNEPPIAGQGRMYLFDRFEDTYTITTPFSSGTVIRQSLCLWNGIDGNGCPMQLLYGGFSGDPETEPAESALKWSVEFQKFESPVEGQPEICTVNYGRLKSGFQNSPTGTYDIPYTTEGPESATVS